MVHGIAVPNHSRNIQGRFPAMTVFICHHGCGRVAIKQNKSGNWMCDTSSSKCPEIKRKNSLRTKEAYSSGKRIDPKVQYKSLSEESKTKMSWSKGLTKETNDRIEELNNTVSDISKQLGILDIVKFVISEEGVKSYIVNKLLELLNSKLYFYLKKLDSNSICVFDEYFEEQIVNDKNKICSYFNFSGAERKSIDLACLFAFSDIRRVQGGVSYNIAIYDELFDSSFDEKGIDLITDILKERVTSLNECSIVISHRKESIKAVTGDVIFLEKENGITRRIDYSNY